MNIAETGTSNPPTDGFAVANLKHRPSNILDVESSLPRQAVVRFHEGWSSEKVWLN